MLNPWQLPMSARLGDRELAICPDFRDVLEILGYLSDESLPEFIRWEIALALFYKDPVPEDLAGEAMAFLAEFLNAGEGQGQPGPRLLDWQRDGQLVVAEVNKVAGREIRQMPFLHWWTFLGWFHGIGEGQLSALVALRDKLRRGKRLEPWEQEFYRQNKDRVALTRQDTPLERAEKDRLNRLLDRAGGV